MPAEGAAPPPGCAGRSKQVLGPGGNLLGAQVACPDPGPGIHECAFQGLSPWTLAAEDVPLRNRKAFWLDVGSSGFPSCLTAYKLCRLG